MSESVWTVRLTRRRDECVYLRGVVEKNKFIDIVEVYMLEFYYRQLQSTLTHVPLGNNIMLEFFWEPN